MLGIHKDYVVLIDDMRERGVTSGHWDPAGRCGSGLHVLFGSHGSEDGAKLEQKLVKCN